MFIRLKKLKGKDYAYLVKNTWTKNGPRQKSKKYLGRCIILQKEKDLEQKELEIERLELEFGRREALIKEKHAILQKHIKK